MDKIILADLTDPTCDVYKLIAACGDGILSSLIASFSDLSSAPLTARILHRLANENINTVSYQSVHPKWLQLYTDTAILETLADPKSPRDGIRRLDMAIIVAGGINRLPMIYDLIRSLQSAIPQTSPPPWPLKRARVTYDQLYAGQPVDEVEDVSVESFITAKSSKPFIVRNFASGASSCPPWRAIDRWSSGDYLLRTAGPGRMVPVELGRAYDEEGWSQQIMPFEDFLHRAGYFDDIPELEKDISMPDIIWSQPSTQHLDYQPPEEPQLNVWVGNAGKIVSPPHTDPFFNCYVQVVGHKRVWLAPPDCEMQGYSAREEGSVIAKEYMSNTSRVPILKLPPEEVWASFPEFKERVYPVAFEAVLGPGDMLYMPPGWWHAMRGEGNGPGWSVSIWF